MEQNDKKKAAVLRLFQSKDDTFRLRRRVVFFAVFFMAAFFALSYHAYDSAATSNATIWKEKADADMRGILLLLEKTHAGDWAVQDGRIYKGGRLLNDNASFVEHLKEVTGSEIALFVGDKVAVSTYDPSGKRLLGQEADAAVKKIVLLGCTPYIGRSDLGDIRPLGAYHTLFDIDGEVVGMIFVGVPQEAEERVLGALTNSLLLTGLVLFLLLLTGLGLLLAYTGRLALPIKEQEEESAEKENAPVAEIAALPVSTLFSPQEASPPKAKDALEAVSSKTLSRIGAFSTMLLQATKTQAEKLDLALAKVGELKEAAKKAAQLLADAKEPESAKGELKEAKDAENMCRQLGESRIAAYEAAEKTKELIKEFQTADDLTSALKERAAAIGEAIREVTDIATQTNLLAFNAAVEAARAGEEGRRFAAVADQVRRLSEDAGKLSTNAANLLTTLENDVNKAMAAIAAGGAEAKESRAALCTIADITANLEDRAKRAKSVTRSDSPNMSMLMEIGKLQEQILKDAEKLLAVKTDEKTNIKELSEAADSLRELLQSEPISFSLAKTEKSMMPTAKEKECEEEKP